MRQPRLSDVFGRGVVHNDRPGERHGLPPDRLEEAIQKVGTVVDGNYGGDVQLYTEIVMKRFALFAFAAGLSGQGLLAQGAAVHSIYILPMTGGLDQYLAERITQDHVMAVVADPKSADAVLTDHIGPGFEQEMDLLSGKKKDDSAPPVFRSAVGRGTIFLVDAHSRRVLWSDYEKPGGSATRDAERIAKKLQTFGK